MKILEELCSVPTAPFAEHRVVKYVERFVSRRRKLKLSRDAFGNLLVLLRGKSTSPRLIFVAHMDHPGFVAREMIDATTLQADFYGGVLSEYIVGAKVRFFDEDREIVGRVISTQVDPERAAYPAAAKIRVKSNVSGGSIGMLDQGTARIKRGKFCSRVCDDLAGAASALTMLDELLKHPPRSTVGVLLTRAEEDGFIGAIASVAKPKLLRKSDRMISIECSAIQPYAQQGDGVILRIGDRTSIFNSTFTYFLNQQAEALMKVDKNFKYQRLLMPGGTCEATVFDAYGYVTGATCVALGNYHNMDRVKKRIAPEYVDVSDWKNMVKLFVRIAMNAHEFTGDMTPLKKRIESRFLKRRTLLRSPLPR